MIKNSNLEYILVKKEIRVYLLLEKRFLKHIDAHEVNDPDVTGAGDTVIAVFSLSFAKTNDVEKSARIANAVAAQLL